jgi:hypothetical protein
MTGSPGPGCGQGARVRGSRRGSLAGRASGPGMQLSSPPCTEGACSSADDADYADRGGITFGSACIYGDPHEPLRPSCEGRTIDHTNGVSGDRRCSVVSRNRSASWAWYPSAAHARELADAAIHPMDQHASRKFLFVREPHEQILNSGSRRIAVIVAPTRPIAIADNLWPRPSKLRSAQREESSHGEKNVHTLCTGEHRRSQPTQITALTTPDQKWLPACPRLQTRRAHQPADCPTHDLRARADAPCAPVSSFSISSAHGSTKRSTVSFSANIVHQGPVNAPDGEIPVGKMGKENPRSGKDTRNRTPTEKLMREPTQRSSANGRWMDVQSSSAPPPRSDGMPSCRQLSRCTKRTSRESVRYIEPARFDD